MKDLGPSRMRITKVTPERYAQLTAILTKQLDDMNRQLPLGELPRAHARFAAEFKRLMGTIEKATNADARRCALVAKVHALRPLH